VSFQYVRSIQVSHNTLDAYKCHKTRLMNTSVTKHVDAYKWYRLCYGDKRQCYLGIELRPRQVGIECLEYYQVYEGKCWLNCLLHCKVSKYHSVRPLLLIGRSLKIETTNLFVGTKYELIS